MSKINLQIEPEKPRGWGVVVLLVVVALAGYYLWVSKDVPAPVERVREIVREVVPLGGDVETNLSRFAKGLIIGEVQQSWVEGQIPNATSSDFWTNDTSDSVIITDAYMYNLTAASSSLNWTIATSTNATSSPTSFADYSHTTGVIADNYLAATSSLFVLRATTTLPLLLPAGQSVIFRLEAMGTSCGGAVGSAVINRSCESATSTARGYNPFWKLHYLKHKPVF